MTALPDTGVLSVYSMPSEIVSTLMRPLYVSSSLLDGPQCYVRRALQNDSFEWTWRYLDVRDGKNLACVNGKEPVSRFMLTHSKWEEHVHMDFLKKNTNVFFYPLNDVVLLNCKTVCVVVYIRNSVTYDTSFDKWKLFQWRGEKPRDRERDCNWKSKQGPYIFLSKHLRCLASGVDSSIEPDHLRSNSLLHWRKTGHFYCQDREKKKKVKVKERGTGGEWKGGINQSKEASEKRTQASGTVKQSDIDSAMAVRLWLRHAHPSASHMWGGYWWSRHIQAEHL